MPTYTRESVNISEILLDVENPRFASYFERIGQNKAEATQEDVVEYLKKYESINVLADRIKEVKGLHPTELLACIKAGDKYIVLEGNRRVCACKELCEQYAKSGEEQELISNITTLEIIVYKTRELAQPYISDKHIDGVKKWESIEKSCYYYRMFQEKQHFTKAISADEIVDIIVKETISKKIDVKDCITKYGFYMSVFEALTSAYSRKALIDTNSFLPLVDRFMKILVSNDPEVGLELQIKDLNYIAHKGQEKLLNEILKIVGEAFLVRKTGESYSADATYRINSSEVDKKGQQKKLIKDDIRIPGLYKLIQNYKEALEAHTDIYDDLSDNTKNDEEHSQNNGTSNSDGGNSNESDEETNENGTVDNDYIYEPDIPWKPKQPQYKTLSFSNDVGKSFVLSNNNDEDVKIKFIISELSRLHINKFPYSCTSLYRLLIESATKKAYDEKKPKENKIILTYDNKSLATAVSKLAKNNALKFTQSERANIVEYIDKKRLIETLNNYMHNPKLVDTDLILSSWITMKDYIKGCLV